MLFKPELAAKIPTGQKTQTRRIKKRGEQMITRPDGVKAVYVIYDSKGSFKTRLKWQVGQTYAIQTGRGQKAIGRFRLLDIRRERVGEISREDCFAEGIGRWTEIVEESSFGAITPEDEFKYLWDSINTAPGLRWQDNPKVWVLSFEYCEGSESK